MKNLLLIVLVLFISGCASNPPIIDPITVKVPIAVKCKPITNITEVKEWPMDRITKDMQLYDKIELVLEQLHLVEGQNKELKSALKECTDGGN